MPASLQRGWPTFNRIAPARASGCGPGRRGAVPHRPARARYLLAGAFSAGGVAAGGVAAGGVAGVVFPASPVAGPVVLRSVTEGVVVFVVVELVVSGPPALRAHNPMSARITSARMKNRV